MPRPLPSGLLNINKPSGLTSRDAVNRVVSVLRRLTGLKKIRAGHCGTLDPLASGVLVLCVGSATRLVSLIQEQQKTYHGRFELGRQTDTDDITGMVIAEHDPESVKAADLQRLLPEFTGRIEQLPPQFSAVHVDGQRAYELARRGETVELKPRVVEIHQLSLTEWSPPFFELRMECGSGTYVRSVGRDLGERLGCGATMTALRRDAIGPFLLGEAIALADLTDATLMRHLQPPLDGVKHLPSLNLNAADADSVRHGRRISAEATSETGPIAMIDSSGALIGIAHQEDGILQPDIILPLDSADSSHDE